MTTEATNTKKEAPVGARLEVVLLIDACRWDELKAQGCSDKDIQKAIEKSITFKDTVSGVITSPPVFDIKQVDLLKYY